MVVSYKEDWTMRQAIREYAIFIVAYILLCSVTFNPHSTIGFYYLPFVDEKSEARIRFMNHHRLHTIIKYQSCDLNQC